MFAGCNLDLDAPSQHRYYYFFNSSKQVLVLSSVSATDPASYLKQVERSSRSRRGLIRYLEESVGVGGVGEGVGEGLPVLGHHAAVGVGDLDAVVADGVVGGGDDDPDGGARELDGAERGEDAGAADGRRHGGAVGAEARRAIGEPAAAWEREAGRDGEEAAALLLLLLLLIGSHGVLLIGSDAI